MITTGYLVRICDVEWSKKCNERMTLLKPMIQGACKPHSVEVARGKWGRFMSKNALHTANKYTAKTK